jgi:hypothetical protein
MAFFLKRENNLSDLDNINEARLNLGFGNVATFNSNNVNITGGFIAVDTLKLLKDDIPPENAFVKYDHETHELKYEKLELSEWVKNDPKSINLSSFENDKYFFKKNELNEIAFTGDYNELQNKPTSYSHLHNDLSFLHIESNLSDVSDINIVKRNLGLGTIANYNTDYINFDNLTINENITFDVNDLTIDNNPKYLHINNEGETFWSNISKASSTNYGVVKLSDEYDTNDPNTVPSSIALFKFYKNITNQIENVTDAENIREDLTIKSYKDTTRLMYGNNNLSELTNVIHSRSNLGFTKSYESFIQQLNNNSTFTFSNITIKNNLIFDFGYDIIEDKTILSVDRFGKVSPKIIPPASKERPGFVYVSDNIHIGSDELKRVTVPSLYAFSNFIDIELKNKFTVLSNSIPTDMNDVLGNEEFMRIIDNIRVDNPSIARENLGLHDLAYSGNYLHLHNTPSNLSYFSNDDTKFMKGENNLSEIKNPSIARNNLELGSISTYDSNNLTILSGSGTFNTLNVSLQMEYNYSNENFTNKYLYSTNEFGLCKWKSLPIASSSTYGLVKIGNNHKSNRDDLAASTSALNKMYFELKGKIDILLDKIYILER